MSVLNANCLAIYYHGAGSTNKYNVLKSQDTVTAYESNLSADVSDTILLKTDGKTFLGFGGVNATTNSFTAAALTLAAAATSSTLEVSNAVEDVARDGSGGTLQQSEMTFSISADGLVKAANDSGEDILDLARDKKYVLIRFQIDDLDYYCQALIDNVSISGNVDEIATYSISLTGVDDLYKAE